MASLHCGLVIFLDCLNGLNVLGNGRKVRFSESVAFFAELRPAVLFRELA